jgi:putative ABC transport system permease protein
VSYTVAQRTREFGIRLALGASARDVVRLVLGAGLRPAAAGIVVGILAAAAVVGFMGALLFEVQATDPGTLAGAAAVLAVVAVLAHWGPLWRALHIDPAAALRQE